MKEKNGVVELCVHPLDRRRRLEADGGGEVASWCARCGALKADVGWEKPGSPLGGASVACAVWSGEVMGVPVHVLDDGRRIVDAEGLTAALERIGAGTLDAGAFAAAYNAWMRGG